MIDSVNLREIGRATRLGQELEALIVSRGQITICCDRCPLLAAYWFLIFEHYKGVLCLLQNDYCAPAFALWRPMLEAMVRACVTLKGSPSDVDKVRRDRYKMDFNKAGDQVAKALDAGPGDFDDLFKSAQSTLHSLTHSGMKQLRSRFDGKSIGANYPVGAIISLVTSGAVSVSVVTLLATKHLQFVAEETRATQLLSEYYSLSRQSSAPRL